MRASVALPSSVDAAAMVRTWLLRAAAFAERRRWWIVGICIVVQWLFVAVAALGFIRHNRWLYQSGDDGPWYWTTAWVLTSLHVPQTAIGLGWPYLLTPFAAIFGPNMGDGLPAIMAFNVLVLAPVAVVGMYLIGERIAGRLFGVWTAVLWTLAPALALALYDDKHRSLVVDTFLPTGTGLNTLSDYPSMVFAIVAAYLLLRALDTKTIAEGVLCGLAFGFLVLMKPANGPLPLVGVIVLGLAFRFRAALAVLAAMVPALVTLTIWKRVGGGALQVLQPTPPQPAGGGGGGGPTTVPVAGASRYLSIDWHHLAQNTQALGQVFWSVRTLELLLLAGAIGLIWRARLRGSLVIGWFVVFGLIKGTVSYSSVYDTSLYRFLLPAWPAWVLILAGVVFCWPGGAAMRARVQARERPPLGPLATKRPLIVTAIVFAVGPLAFALAATPVGKGTIAQMNYTGAPVPIVDFRLRARRAGTPHTVELNWRGLRTARASGWYQVFKGKDPGCDYPSQGAKDCLFRMQLVYSTRSTTFQDQQASGQIVYRIALAAGGRIDSNTSSYLLLSKPVSVTVP